jgi:hypothetical protein
MTRYKSRTPKILSERLALDHDEVTDVLKSFKGLFRESSGTCSYGECYYTLQLRYARRWLEKEDDSDAEEESDPKEPLEAEYLGALLEFISAMVEHEQAAVRQGTSNRSALIGAWIAACAAIIAALIASLGIVLDLISNLV